MKGGWAGAKVASASEEPGCARREPHAFPALNQGRLSTKVGLWRLREFREMVIIEMCKVRGIILPVVSHYISENNMQEKKGHHARLTHFSNVRIQFS
jgi:hypothetical protein